MANKCLKAFISQCPVCLSHNHAAVKYHQDLKPNLDVPALPWIELHADFAGPFPVNDQGDRRLILVMIDPLSQMILLEDCPEKHTAEDVAEIIFRRVIAEYGIPARFHTDNGPTFAAEVIKAVCSLLGMKKTFTAAYTPNANGLSENAVKQVKAQPVSYTHLTLPTICSV